MESDMQDFGTVALGRDVYCRLDAARLEQMRANLINAEPLGARFAPLRADQARSVKMTALLHGRAKRAGAGKNREELESGREHVDHLLT